MAFKARFIFYIVRFWKTDQCSFIWLEEVHLLLNQNPRQFAIKLFIQLGSVNMTSHCDYDSLQCV